MTRSKKKLPPQKNHQLTIRFTEELYNVLTVDAEAAGLPRAEYIQQLITNRKPVIKQEIAFNDPQLLQIFRNLEHYGFNLNQIAWYLNLGGMKCSLSEDVYSVRSLFRSSRS